jgi:hypothetical protein
MKKVLNALLNGVASWCRTPRTKFVVDEVCVSDHRTDPPIRGVLLHPQTLTSFTSSKAQGVLHSLADTVQQKFLSREIAP